MDNMESGYEEFGKVELKLIRKEFKPPRAKLKQDYKGLQKGTEFKILSYRLKGKKMYKVQYSEDLFIPISKVEFI